jgi:hypothetical protein
MPNGDTFASTTFAAAVPKERLRSEVGVQSGAEQ